MAQDGRAGGGWGAALTAALLLSAAPAAADLKLPPGFKAELYVTGEGFAADTWRGRRGIPSTSTLAVDHSGTLYLARTGRRYMGGEGEDLWPIYRIPPGGARLTPDTEARYLHGPPLRNVQVAAIRSGRELFLTTFDRDRGVGVLYRMVNGRVELFAGGTPPEGGPPALRQPEGAAADSAGRLYVADRARGAVLRLDASGRLLDPRYVSAARPRLLGVFEDHLWVAGDGEAEVPWQRGPGEIWRVAPDGTPRLLLRGPVASGMSVGPGGHLFVADRHGARIFVLTPEGRLIEFARFTEGDAPRALCFVPVTPDTRRTGIAGSLLVVAIRDGAWPVNEVLRVTGPFDAFLGEARE